MKLNFHHRDMAAKRGCQRAFTLVELQLSTVVIVLVISAVIASNLIGMKMYEVTRTKVSASDHARYAVGLLTQDIRTANRVQIGSGSLGSFTAVSNGVALQGAAIKIYPTTNATPYIQYYLDSADQKLKRFTNGATAASVVAEFVTNSVVFKAEDHRGTNLTAFQGNWVVGLNLQFYQLQYPVVTVGAGGLYDYYQLNTKITRRPF